MDQRKHGNDSSETPKNQLKNSNLESRDDDDLSGAVAARKILKADRERLRRDRINEQFQELGSILDPDRPKNDKSTILTDTIQTLKDLTSEVDKLKAEYTALCDETRELMQEKSELREEKSSLKSDIEHLRAQYQHSYRLTFPWAAYDHSMVMAPPNSFVPLPISPGPMQLHPTMQPFPLFGSQPFLPPNHCSTFIPYTTPATPRMEQTSTVSTSPSCATTRTEQTSTSGTSPSHASAKQEPKVRPSNNITSGSLVKPAGPVDVRTDLELKVPGTNLQKEFLSGGTKGKQHQIDEKNIEDSSDPSRHSSSGSFHGSSSDSVGDV